MSGSSGRLDMIQFLINGLNGFFYFACTHANVLLSKSSAWTGLGPVTDAVP